MIVFPFLPQRALMARSSFVDLVQVPSIDSNFRLRDGDSSRLNTVLKSLIGCNLQRKQTAYPFSAQLTDRRTNKE